MCWATSSPSLLLSLQQQYNKSTRAQLPSPVHFLHISKASAVFVPGFAVRCCSLAGVGVQGREITTCLGLVLLVDQVLPVLAEGLEIRAAQRET